MRADASARHRHPGAGPVGCALALLLQRQGRSVALVRKRKDAPASSAHRAVARQPPDPRARRRLANARAHADRHNPRLAAGRLRPHAHERGGRRRAGARVCRGLRGAAGRAARAGNARGSIRVPRPSPPRRCSPSMPKARLRNHRARNYGQEALVAQVTTRPGARQPPGNASRRRPARAAAAGRALWRWYGARARSARANSALDGSGIPRGASQRLRQARRRIRSPSASAAAFRSRCACAPTRVGEREATSATPRRRCIRSPARASISACATPGIWRKSCVTPRIRAMRACCERFAALRRIDATATVRVTDFLAGAFLGTNPLSRLMRGFGLTALDICLPARRFFARRMIFGAPRCPDRDRCLKNATAAMFFGDGTR